MTDIFVLEKWAQKKCSYVELATLIWFYTTVVKEDGREIWAGLREALQAASRNQT